MAKLPFIKKSKRKICLICEGYEEYDYLSRLIELDVWSDVYSFSLVNAESNGNISARYQDRYQSDFYDIVLAFCDTDRAPHDDYELIRTKINAIFGNESAADKVIIFANPCTMQIELLHFGDVKLRTQNKNKNAKIIKEFTGIENYKASEEQRQKMCSQITKVNYLAMKDRLTLLSTDCSTVSSSNFAVFLKFFESADTSWIDEINSSIEE